MEREKVVAESRQRGRRRDESNIRECVTILNPNLKRTKTKTTREKSALPHVDPSDHPWLDYLSAVVDSCKRTGLAPRAD